MSPDCTVSVIIPAFNAAHTLPEAIDSVQVPEGVKVEIIVVDDGSTDNTAEVLQPFIESGSIRYEGKENEGAAAARNYGLKLAKYRYIAFLDADDVMTPGSLLNRLQVFERFPSLDVVFGDYFLVEEARRSRSPDQRKPVLAGKGFPSSAAAYIDREENGIYLFNERFHHFYLRATPRPIWTGAVMISRRIVEKKGVFDTTYAIGEDNEYWQRLITGNSVGFVPEPVSSYLHHRSNLTRDPVRYMDDEIRYNRQLYSSAKTECREYLKDVFFLRRRIGSCHFNKGYHYYRSGVMARARKEMENAIRCWPFNLKAYKVLLLSMLKVNSASRRTG